MKKFLSFLFVLSLCCALTACGGQNAGSNSDEPQSPATTLPTEPDNGSQSQETPDTSDVLPVDDAPDSSESGDESSTGNGTLIVYFTYGENAPLADGVDASTSASIQYRGDELTGNTGFVADMIAEATGGSGFSSTIRAIESAEPDATVLEGLALRDNRSTQAEDDVINWLTGLGLAG